MADFNLDEDMDIDALPDAPSFDPWPGGVYPVAFNDGIVSDVLKEKEVRRLPFDLTGEPTLEDNYDSTLPIPKPGATNEVIFFVGTEFGVGQYKKVLMSMAAKLGVKKVREVQENSKGLTGNIVLGVREYEANGEKRKQNVLKEIFLN